MIIYSVIVSVDRDASAQWLDWMTSVHIPDVMRTGYFRSHSVRRVLDPVEHDRDTYTIEYTCESRERFEAYQRDAAPALQADHSEKFSGRFVASRRVSEAPPHADGETCAGSDLYDPRDPDVVSAIDDLPLWSAPFGFALLDVVVSNNGVNNVADEAQAFREIARVARPGAQVAFAVNTPGTMKEFYDVLRDVLSRRGSEASLDRLERHIFEKRKPIEHVRRTVEGAGLRVDRILDGEFHLRFADDTAMLDHFLIKFAFLPSWRCVLQPGETPVILDEIRDALDRVAERDGEVRLTVPWICVDARNSPA